MEAPVKSKSLKKKLLTRKDIKCLGPLRSLESYVQSDWWSHIFNSFYLKTDADVVDDNNITKSEVDLIVKTLNLKTDEKILDLCCGQGRHSLELDKHGFTNVEGLDRSHYLIQRARAEAKKNLMNVKFREGDARKLPFPPDTFDVVMILGNSFGYFETIQDDLRVLKDVFRVLKPWGRILIDIVDGEYLKNNFKPRSWEWISKKYFVCRERSLSLDKQRLISREIVTHVGKGVIVDQLYSDRIYSKENLIELLKKAGFGDMKFHGEIFTESVRNQDLGMMEKRIVTTSIARKEWTSIKSVKKETVKNVVVLMGDSSKPDSLKPAGVFDADDFYTIDKLKDALRDINNYGFTYLFNHNNLIADLIKSKQKLDFVFNLCDEGYNNDPVKELHVPSLLEMLDIPYSGSPPQCLAYCYDKSLVRGIAKEIGLPVPEAFFINPNDNVYELSFNFPVIVKPNYGDSSFGITQRSVVESVEELINAISDIREKLGYDKPILVEEFLTGKDLSVGIIGNPPNDYIFLPIIEEDYSSLPKNLPRICGYEAKWLPNSPYGGVKSIPANLPEETERIMIDWCLKIFERLDCRDYIRFDWRLNGDGSPKLLEVNPNPGWCWDGHLANMSKIAGISYADMLKMILEATSKRLSLANQPHLKDS